MTAISPQIGEVRGAPIGERVQAAQDVAKIVGSAARVFHDHLNGISPVDRRKAMCEFVRALTIAEASPYLVDPADLSREILSRLAHTGRAR